MPDMRKTKSERLTAVLENMKQMKSERLIYKRRSLNVSITVLANVIQMKSEHLIHIKAKFKCLTCRRRSLNV